MSRRTPPPKSPPARRRRVEDVDAHVAEDESSWARQTFETTVRAHNPKLAKAVEALRGKLRSGSARAPRSSVEPRKKPR